MTDDTAPMDYRSLSFHGGFPDPQLIRRGAELGFNDVCFQTEGGLMRKLQDLRDRADRSGYFELMDELDMTCSVWAHELADYDEAWGECRPDNDRLWEGIEERYDYILGELLPEIDNLVLTVVETEIPATDPEFLAPLTAAIHAACRRHDARLILRSFVHHPYQFEQVKDALGAISDDIVVMTKAIPQDWHMRSIDDPLIGEVGEKPQYVEVDIAGEYFRMDHVANCFTEILAGRFERWCEAGCEGVSVRVDRAWEPWKEPQTTVLDQAQEANLWTLGYLASGRSDSLQEIWQDYTTTQFGEAAAGTMQEALRPTGEVVAEALYVESEPFGEQKYDYAHPFALMNHDRTAVAYPDDEDQVCRNPFHQAWSVFRWDESYRPRYQMIRRGDPEVIDRKEDTYAEAEESARRSLSLIDEVDEDLPDGAYRYFRFRLEENLWHLRFMCEMQLAWLKLSCVLYEQAPERDSRLREEARQHLNRAETMAEEAKTQSITALWRNRVYHCRRGQYIDTDDMMDRFREYWGEVL